MGLTAMRLRNRLGGVVKDFDAASRQTDADRVKQLIAENNRFRQELKAAASELAELKAEVTRLQQDLEVATAPVVTVKPPVPARSSSPKKRRG